MKAWWIDIFGFGFFFESHGREVGKYGPFITKEGEYEYQIWWRNYSLLVSHNKKAEEAIKRNPGYEFDFEKEMERIDREEMEGSKKFMSIMASS